MKISKIEISMKDDRLILKVCFNDEWRRNRVRTINLWQAESDRLK